MNDSNHKRHHVVLGTDLLESRMLLNAHLPQSPIVHVASLHAEAATRPITGKLKTQFQYLPPDPSNPMVNHLTFTGSGTSTLGSVQLTAHSEVQIAIFVSKTRKNTEVDSFSNGVGTITLGDGTTLSLKFTGNRKTVVDVKGKSSQPATYTLNGTATVQSGPNQGQVETFRATGTGPGNKNAVTYRFTLK